MFKNLYEKFLAFFHTEVDDITAPIRSIIGRLEAFNQKIAAKVFAARAVVLQGETELAKGAKVAANLTALVNPKVGGAPAAIQTPIPAPGSAPVGPATPLKV